jgi:hypothetical protein
LHHGGVSSENLRLRAIIAHPTLAISITFVFIGAKQ